MKNSGDDDLLSLCGSSQGSSHIFGFA